MTDVGDAVTLTFATTTGATVTAETLAPSGAVTGPTSVAESPAASGAYPFTFVGDEAAMWRVVFRSTTPTAVQVRWVRFTALTGVPPLATPDDVTARWRPLTAAEEALVSTLIDDASRIVRQRIGTVDARIADGTLDPELVAAVVARMVKRVMEDPSGRLQSWTVDDYTERWNEIQAGLWISDDDLGLLLPAGESNGAFTIRPAYEAPVGCWP